MNNLLKKYFLILIFITINIFPKCDCSCCCKKKNNITRNKTNNTFSIIHKQKEKIKLKDDKKKKENKKGNQHEEILKKHGKERSQKLEKQKEEKEKLEKEKQQKLEKKRRQKEEEEKRKKIEEEQKRLKEEEEKRKQLGKEKEEKKKKEEEEKIRKQIEKEEEERKRKLDEDERKRKEIEDYYYETTERTNLDYKKKLDEFFLEKNKNNHFPNLEFIKNLGEGGFGTVGLYKNTVANELVAVKIINEGNLKEKLLYQEFKILNSLGEHLNIVKVKGLFHEGKHYKIVQEYCKFGDLYNHIIKKGALKVEDAQYFFYQLINAIDYLHKHNIAHRDIKPKNILITDNNILKICDFDFAKRIKKDEPLIAYVGTKGYSAPEVFHGEGYDGKKNDIWSCGVVLYNMLTNNSWPYDIKEYYKLTKNKFSWNTKLIKDKSKSALDLLSKIFIFNPEKRITIEGIKKHKFYKEGEKIFLNNITMNILKNNKF